MSTGTHYVYSRPQINLPKNLLNTTIFFFVVHR